VAGLAIPEIYVPTALITEKQVVEGVGEVEVVLVAAIKTRGRCLLD
jgi:hypothetical protein